MPEEKSATEQAAYPRPCCSLPIRLYDIDGLLFELYEGGQPYQRHSIFWNRLGTGTETQAAAALEEHNHD
jgi:hypothetical protein